MISKNKSIRKLKCFTGKVPGMAASNKETCEFTDALKSIPAPENSFDFVSI